MALKPNAFRAGIRNLVAGGHDFTLRQLAIMIHCYEVPKQEAQTVRGLAEVLKVNKPSITRGVDKLVELSFMHRETDAADRRSVLVTLTENGLKLIESL